MDRKTKENVSFLGAIAVALICVLSFFMFGMPIYGVWKKGKVGQARLAQAEQEKQIMIAQAEAERDAAKLRAEAIGIVGQAAQDFPEYRQQEFFGAFAQALENGTIDQIVYIPTEGMLPITEAGARINGR